MEYYLIYDYNKKNPETNEPAIKEVDEDKLFTILQDAHYNRKKIAIYKLGKCILDWS